MNHRLIGGVLAAALACAAQPVLAQEARSFTIGIGAHQVQPKSNNGSLLGGAAQLEIGDNVQPTITFEYFVRENLGIEVLAATPFKHDIEIKGLGKVATTKHLPPTFSLQYHWNSDGAVSPFVGVGVNYTTFMSEKTTGPLRGSKLKLEDSVGVAAHVGVDFGVGERGAIRVDARWIDINSDVELNGEKIGKAEIDPLVYGLAYVIKF
ncbi:MULTISPECIES: OmpW/AlkL family protein [Lysobacter]|jgi:outer membrane protein|uniref:Outer membrane beta-barrel protein n=1 Tax=Lysobacter gummosus TaxID=262324 RepID=A0ABY3XFZ5_9GAMM|nr:MULTISPECIES: OmpW family outer membrane protein [Lysobacter]ALN89974.1 ompW family protein [Lysobacter gummosus]UJB18160.1 outer membrane beta-barrel protein [Lysobacter capsici]UJQ28117.1 outer membrane beta-barrel protein [Lysobacter gummosus]UNP30561.1 outer membrane beta-barrel protein [Lysobacter gummosus]